MKIKSLTELKNKQVAMLNSPRSNYHEYGVAFGAMYELSKNWPQELILGDEYLIDEIARQYTAQEQKLYEMKKEYKHLLHIKAATELYKKNRASKEEIKKYLNPNFLNLNQAKVQLKKSRYYNDMKPSDVIQAMKEMKRQ